MSVVYSTKKIVRTGTEACRLTISCTGSDGGAIRGIRLEILDAKTGLAAAVQSYEGQPVTVSLPVNFTYIIKVRGSVQKYQLPQDKTGILAADSAVAIVFPRAIRYGFRRNKSNSNPDSRIEYTFDAVGKTPMHVDTGGTHLPVWGSGSTWQAFCDTVATPVMLNSDGTEAYELARNNQTKKADGSPSDLSNPNFAGNAMVRFAGFPWVQRYEDSAYEYVTFSDVRYDDSYHAYAHTNEKGQVMPAFYKGMFEGSNVDSRLRSLADRQAVNSCTRSREAELARNAGAGYYTTYKAEWDYLCDLLTLISKNDDCQAKFGTGRCGATSAIATGTLKTAGPFWGSSDAVSGVKVFYVENFWGNVWESCAGFVTTPAGVVKTKMTPPYNLDGAGYDDTGYTCDANAYIDKASVSDKHGFIPLSGHGSSTTYYADALAYQKGAIRYALVGGGWQWSGYVGMRNIDIYNGVNTVHAMISTRLTWIPLKES